MHFNSTLCRRVSPAGDDFYVMNVPRPVADALNLAGGGHVSLELIGGRRVRMRNYNDSPPVTQLAFVIDDDDVGRVLEKPVTPKTRGQSRPTPMGYDCSTGNLRAIRQGLRWAQAEFKRMFPCRRGVKKKPVGRSTINKKRYTNV